MTKIKRKLERKPLSFSTTMRNPFRIAKFISCLENFEKKILSIDVIRKIIEIVIDEKIYSTVYQKSVEEYKQIYFDESANYSHSQLKDIIENSPQNHKEAGFDKGWPSRFDTWYKFPKELGFVFYEMGKPIEISESGHLLIDSLKLEYDDSNKLISNVFLNAMVKYHTSNPFRRNLNSNAPIVLLLKTINDLEKNHDWDKSGIYRHEIPFLTCWQDEDSSKLAKFINDFRLEYGFKPSKETVYNICLNLLESTNTTRFKPYQIMVEGVDDFIRKLRITGIISLRGMGRLLDINKFESEKVNYILNSYNKHRIFSNEYSYYKFMGSIDHKLVDIFSIEDNFDIDDIRQKNLKKWADTLNKIEVYNELKILENKNGVSKHEVLKLIDGPTRFEFLTSIALKQHFNSIEIKPNYRIDDEGMPTFTAIGGIGDIEVYSDTDDVLVEVTLMRNKSQGVNEIPAITRHLKDFSDHNNKTVYSLFIAPSLHEDTIYMIEFTKSRHDLNIYGFTINGFVNLLPKCEKISDLIN